MGFLSFTAVFPFNKFNFGGTKYHSDISMQVFDREENLFAVLISWNDGRFVTLEMGWIPFDWINQEKENFIALKFYVSSDKVKINTQLSNAHFFINQPTVWKLCNISLGLQQSNHRNSDKYCWKFVKLQCMWYKDQTRFEPKKNKFPTSHNKIPEVSTFRIWIFGSIWVDPHAMVHSLIMTIGSWSVLLVNILINQQPVGVIPTRTRPPGFRVTFFLNSEIWTRSLSMLPLTTSRQAKYT